MQKLFTNKADKRDFSLSFKTSVAQANLKDTNIISPFRASHTVMKSKTIQWFSKRFILTEGLYIYIYMYIWKGLINFYIKWKENVINRRYKFKVHFQQRFACLSLCSISVVVFEWIKNGIYETSGYNNRTSQTWVTIYLLLLDEIPTNIVHTKTQK